MSDRYKRLPSYRAVQQAKQETEERPKLLLAFEKGNHCAKLEPDGTVSHFVSPLKPKTNGQPLTAREINERIQGATSMDVYRAMVSNEMREMQNRLVRKLMDAAACATPQVILDPKVVVGVDMGRPDEVVILKCRSLGVTTVAALQAHQ